MNLHPILVHFPIALLTIYALLECVRSKRAMEIMHAFHVKGTLVIIGALGAAAAYATGPEKMARSLVGQMHQKFATATLIIFSIIALAYLWEWFWPSKHSNFMMRPYIIIPLAIIGLVAVTITGGLGGALVYGTHFDPFLAPVFKFLGVY